MKALVGRIAGDARAMRCEGGCTHVVGIQQVARLEGTPCCWCGRPMHLVAPLGTQPARH